jgi:hypothetical protein
VLKQIIHLREQAERCRRLAHAIDDQDVRNRLLAMAEEFEHEIESGQIPPRGEAKPGNP